MRPARGEGRRGDRDRRPAHRVALRQPLFGNDLLVVWAEHAETQIGPRDDRRKERQPQRRDARREIGARRPGGAITQAADAEIERDVGAGRGALLRRLSARPVR
jgi:hypothetical protein